MRVTVGLISDTHGLVRPGVRSAFRGVSQIVHAGDVGSRRVLDELAAIAPVDAVYGNVDDPADPALAAQRMLIFCGVSLHVSHGHELGRPSPAIVAARYAGDVLVFGHTHRAIVADEDGRLVVNPGAAGPRRFDIQPSVAVLTIDDGRPSVQIIELA